MVGRSWQIFLLVDSRANLRWPRPPMGANAIALTVDERLLVDIGLPWAEVEKPKDQCVAFFEDFLLTEGTKVSLFAFLAALVRWRPRSLAARHSLFGHVLMQVGSALEKVLLEVLEHGPTQGTMQVAPVNFDPSSESVDSISRRLVRYHEAQLRTFEQTPQYIALASDKSRVLGSTLMQTSITLPDNSAMRLARTSWARCRWASRWPPITSASSPPRAPAGSGSGSG